MRRRLLAISLAFLLGLTAICYMPACTSSSIVWKKVPPPPGGMRALGSASVLPFDMHRQLSYADVIFKGKILSHQDYEVSWIKDGIEYGPFGHGIMRVQVLEAYIGRTGETLLNIYFPFPIDTPFEDSFPLVDGREYIFFAHCFGEEFLQENLIGTPYYKTEIEKRADLSVGDNFYCVLPIENSMVVANTEYDFQRRAVSLPRRGSAESLAPESFSLFNGGEYGIITYRLFDEEYFVSALRHFAEIEGMIP